MNLLDKLTLVIPTHYRHKYLNRLLSYYEGGGLKILVADSTNITFEKKNDYEIDYFHYPDAKLVYKLKDIVSKVQTPYMLFCADDDFWVKESISECIEFLEKNNDYSSVQGNYIGFEENNEIEFIPSYLHATSIEANAVSERLNQCMQNYMPLFYAIHKTEVIQKVFLDNYKTNISHAILNELSVSFYSLICGKHKKLDILTYARDWESISTPVARDSLADISKSEKYKKEYLEFKRNISTFISEQNLKLDNNNIIEKALQINILKREKQVPRARTLKFIYKSFPFIQNIKEKIKNKKILSKLKNVYGYPISDKNAISSWNIIQSFIKKYNI